MKIYRGKSVYGGIVIGRIRVYRKKEQQVICYGVEDVEGELQRFHKAKEKAAALLKELYRKAVSEVGEEHAAIFEIHRLILEEGDYPAYIEDMIKTSAVNVECAVGAARDNFSALFSSMEDEYMNARVSDIRDVSQRLLTVLEGEEARNFKLREPVIVVADDLAPSETVQMDKDRVLSFVVCQGSVNSHAAILARSMGIPALVKLKADVSLSSLDGKLGIVDAEEGYLYVEPDEDTLRRMQEAQITLQKQTAQLQSLKGKESVTLDGQRVALYANISNARDLKLALDGDAEGIGLFRSEFLYLERETYPTEEEQFQIYKKVLETMNGKQVVIRTLDIGADKQAAYFQLEKEENPAMGLRAIRLCLTRPEMFRHQLRALFRASAYGKLAIMYPMITSVDEVKWVRKMAQEVEEQLRQQGIPCGKVEQGIMIETPAAVVISDLLAREVDFFSIGTNDLTQYTLAIDRQNQALEAFYDPHHPAVLRMIRKTLESAHKAGIWCGICGELGADKDLTRLFLALGVDELSVAPGSLLPLRKLVRETDVEAQRKEVLEKWFL